MELLIAILIAYLIGSIPVAVILGKLAGIGDIRKVGSGNIGATNMLRAGGKKLAIATLLLDISKGAVAHELAFSDIMMILHDLLYGPAPVSFLGYGAAQIVGAPFIILAVMLGHMLPIWLKFRGGKGVATMIGFYLCLIFTHMKNPDEFALILFAISPVLFWLVGFIAFRTSSIPGILAAWVPVFLGTVLPLLGLTVSSNLEYHIYIAGIIALCVTLKNLDNIRR